MTLVSEVASIAPGKTFTVAIVMEPERGWHTYWKNPGDSGMATDLEWSLPQGFSPQPAQYPAPEVLAFGSLVNYGYSGDTALLVDIVAPRSVDGPIVTLAVDAHWLVCDDEICIPEDTSLTLVLPAGDGAIAPENQLIFSKARAALPTPFPQGEGWSASFWKEGGKSTFAFGLPAGGTRVRKAHFFPLTKGVVDYAAPQVMGLKQKSAMVAEKPDTAADTLYLQTSAGRAQFLDRISGVLALTNNEGMVENFRVELNAGRGAAPAFRPIDVGANSQSSLAPGVNPFVAFAFAFLAGLLLNVMPCVFPSSSMPSFEIKKCI
ncbi:MAG: protein-disulfide reductase DsbD domain-containing protein [Pseudomonadota bacterium]